MSRHLRYAAALLIAFLVLSAESCPPSLSECLKRPNNHLILVLPGATVSLDEAHISRIGLNQVVWMYVSPDGSTGATLNIRFKVPAGKNPPFKGMNPDGSVPNCFRQGAFSLCVSGPIADDASIGYKYEYDQEIKTADKSVVKDAGIIIER